MCPWPLTLPYDFDNGNAAFDVVIQTVAPVVFTQVSPTGGDATLVQRSTTLLTNAWFDWTAPWAAPAVEVYLRIPHRPASEAATNANLNIALLYGSYRVLIQLLPKQRQIWRDMMTDLGLDPDDDSTDLTTAVGIGNVAGEVCIRQACRWPVLIRAIFQANFQAIWPFCHLDRCRNRQI